MTNTLRTGGFLVGFGALYAVLAGLAEIDATGRYGLAILAVVLLATVVVERMLGNPQALRTLGFGRPTARAVLAAAAIALLLQAVFPAFALLTDATFSMKESWPWLLIGIFAFHGLAEELVWRGYAFRRLREGRSFRRAVLLTMPLIAATHLLVIAQSGLAVGLAAMAVAAITTLPLAHLYELGRNTLWAPALVHTGIDSFKLVDLPDDGRVTLSLAFAAVSITVPLLALAVRRTTTSTSIRTPTPRRNP